jgi:hypothetical protein
MEKLPKTVNFRKLVCLDYFSSLMSHNEPELHHLSQNNADIFYSFKSLPDLIWKSLQAPVFDKFS